MSIFFLGGPNRNIKRNPYNVIFQGGSGPPFHAKLQFRSVLSGAHPLSSTHRAWGIIQYQDGDADSTFIQRRQVPTFKGANVHPLI